MYKRQGHTLFQHVVGICLVSKQTGKLQTLILRGREEDNLAWLEKLHPLFMDSVPLTLEEIFIYELGGVDDAVRKNVL